MSRLPVSAAALVAGVRALRVRAGSDTYGTIRTDIVPRRHVARHRDNSGRPALAEPAAADDRRHDVDVRGGPADEHAVAARHDSVVASVADDGDDGLDGAVAEQRAADADQHARGVHLASRVPRHVRERRGCSGDANRG